MKLLKGFGVVSLLSVFFLKASFVFGFLMGLFKGFLSYTCIIGVSGHAVADASSYLYLLGLGIFIYFVYQKFFR